VVATPAHVSMKTWTTQTAISQHAQSTTESTPVLNIGIIPERKNLAGVNRLSASDRVHQLCRIAVKSAPGHHAKCWYNDRPDPFKNDQISRVVLVFNQMGLAQVRADALQALQAILLSTGAKVLDWNEHLPCADVPMAAPKLAKRYRNANLPPEAGRRGPPGAAAVDDTHLLDCYSSLRTYVPDERFSDPRHLVYTDGSKLNTSITAAVYQEANDIRETLRLYGHDQELNTVLRAELAGIHKALHVARPPDNLQALCILTDSLTSIHLLNRALYNPESLRFHKHKQLLFETAEALQSRPFPVHIMKVRAHTGVRGNEMADQLATQAHDPESGAVTGRFFAAGTSGRGPHWVQYLVPLPDDRGFERWNANDLQQHLLKLASAEQTKLVFTDPKTSILKKIKGLLNEHGGLDVQASQAIWACTTLSPWKKRMAALIRSQRLWTTARMVKCRRRNSNDDQPTDATCPYCFHGIDDVYHALNDCGAGHAKPACTLRHDDAVCRVVTATLAGDNAERLLLWDATSATRTPGEETDRKLPAWILSHAEQHSIPDIFQISIPKGYEGPGPSLAAKQHGVITLVEIKYAPDPDLNGAVRKQAKDQHKDLRTSLLAQGWGTVNLYPVIIRNAGTITNTANDALQALGVDAAARMTLLKRLAVDSLRRTAEIWKPRLGQRTSRGAPPRPVPSPIPPDNPDAPGPIDPPVQQDDAPPNPAVEEHPDVADDHQPSTDSVPDTEHMPWQIITRSRARRTGADATAGPSQATQAVLHEQARPSKRSRNRFAALESDDVLRPQSADAQPSCGASHPSATAQDEATQTSPCIHTARP